MKFDDNGETPGLETSSNLGFQHPTATREYISNWKGLKYRQLEMVIMWILSGM